MQSDSGKLFIGGISWDTNEERLKEYFGSYGEVVEAVIMKDRTTGRARGFGFVVFSDPIVAERVTKERHNIDGRMVEAKKAVPRDDHNIPSRNGSPYMHGSPGPGRTRKIFVGGLASTVTESDFKKYFDQFGTIMDVVVMYDHNTQRPRGFGFITFDSEDAVDKVLVKTFHELNGKMVEVKRAIPKELSPGPNRSPFSGYPYGLNRANNFLNGYTQGYAQGYPPGAIGGYGLNRLSPVSAARNTVPPFGSSYGMGMNFDPLMSPSFGGNTSFGSNPNFGHVMNPYFVGNSNRYSSPTGFDGGNGGNSSFFSSVTHNLWGNGGSNLNSSTPNSGASYMGSGPGNMGGNLFGSNMDNWSPARSQGIGIDSVSDLMYGVGDTNFSLDTNGFRRNVEDGGVPLSFKRNGSGLDGPLADLRGGILDYGDPTWRAPDLEREGPGAIGYGLAGRPGSSSIAPNKLSPGFIGGYNISKRHTNRGISG